MAGKLIDFSNISVQNQITIKFVVPWRYSNHLETAQSLRKHHNLVSPRLKRLMTRLCFEICCRFFRSPNREIQVLATYRPFLCHHPSIHLFYDAYQKSGSTRQWAKHGIVYLALTSLILKHPKLSCGSCSEINPYLNNLLTFHCG